MDSTRRTFWPGLAAFFQFREHGTNLRTEFGAGVTTFLTLAYIIFVQPAILSGRMFGFETGMDFGSVMAATCLAGALATLIMGLWANYPIAQAPGMGENFFFVFSVIPAAAALIAARGWTDTSPWQVALGVVFISGVLFLLLSLLKVRQALIDSVSPSLKNGIAVGIGVFIAFIGLQNAKVVVANSGTLVMLTDQLLSADILVFGIGLLVMAALTARKVKGAILIGIGTALLAALVLGKVSYSGLLAAPPSLSPTLLKMDIPRALVFRLWPYIIIFLFMDVFDTMGTLIGVAEQAGFIKDNRLPRAGRALLSDAVGTVAGAAMGTSTVTSFIESSAGVAHGGRTGLTAVVTAGGFIFALFFSPLVRMVADYPPITAPALVVVGAMMIRNVVKIDWSDFTECFPAFLVIIGIPLSYSIADGIAWSFIAYPLIKLFSGRGREVSWITYLVGGLFLLRYLLPYLERL
ncbi:MAG: NCS2 family permease [Candidatus Erginobacter occultus]|nr:NCS2 family permease [Candidatus Erginobacter occultus]